MDSDRNLLFGVLALQADLIDDAQFARACSEWASRKQTPLAELLVDRGWLTPSDRADVEKLLERKLRKHQGDARASLAEALPETARRSLAGLADADIRQSVAGLTTPAQGPVLVPTTAYEPAARDRYTLSRLHASGGIGQVWLARDASLGRDVALKELRPERAGSPAVWARFLREAQVTGQLEHPGIVPIYELGRRPDDQQPYYTMRFVRGRTLAEAVASYHRRRAEGEAGPLELRELLTAFVGVCNAVAYAHSRGVLHRDLKPQNVVLGDYGEVIVLDWGLARVMGQPDDAAAPLELSAGGEGDGTVQGQVLGTPAYMAPEQAEGRLDLLGPATDVYGLGAILYEVLTGRPPFQGDDLSPEHLQRLYLDNTLGFVYARQGKFGEAWDVLAPLEKPFLRVLGADHPDVATYYENLALAEEGLSHLDTAEALLRKAYTARKKAVGEDSGFTRRAAAYLARVCLARGKTDEAVGWLRALIAAGQMPLGSGPRVPSHPHPGARGTRPQPYG
jgi:tRNA A-37 threonylcarbamoyl transferase component Bud32